MLIGIGKYSPSSSFSIFKLESESIASNKREYATGKCEKENVLTQQDKERQDKLRYLMAHKVYLSIKSDEQYLDKILDQLKKHCRHSFIALFEKTRSNGKVCRQKSN